MSGSKPSSVRELDNPVDEKHLETAPSLEQTYLEAGLSPDDAYFLANFSQERIKKCVRKVKFTLVC